MATVNINGTIRHWDHVEVLAQWVTPAGDLNQINHIIDGTLAIKEGGYARHDWDYNGSSLVTDRREGRANISTIGLSIKRSDLMGSDELHDRMLLASNTSDGFVPSFTLIIIGRDYRGATAGEQLQFDNCVFAGGFEASHGDQHDVVPIAIESPQPIGTLTAVV